MHRTLPCEPLRLHENGLGLLWLPKTSSATRRAFRGDGSSANGSGRCVDARTSRRLPPGRSPGRASTPANDRRGPPTTRDPSCPSEGAGRRGRARGLRSGPAGRGSPRRVRASSEGMTWQSRGSSESSSTLARRHARKKARLKGFVRMRFLAATTRPQHGTTSTPPQSGPLTYAPKAVTKFPDGRDLDEHPGTRTVHGLRHG